MYAVWFLQQEFGVGHHLIRFRSCPHTLDLALWWESVYTCIENSVFSQVDVRVVHLPVSAESTVDVVLKVIWLVLSSDCTIVTDMWYV